MLDLETELLTAAGTVPDVDPTDALRTGARRRRRRRRLGVGALGAAVVCAAVVAGVVVDRGSSTPRTLHVSDDPAPTTVFSTPTGVVLLFDDGYDGATALDLDTGVVGRRVVEGQRAGDEGPPFRAGDSLVVGWGPPSIAPLDGSPSIPLEGAFTYVPSTTGDIWAATVADGNTPAEYRHYDETARNIGTWPADGRGYPQLAVPGGLVFAVGTNLEIWQFATDSVVDTFPGSIALAASPTQLAYCVTGTCDEIRVRSLTDAAASETSAVFAPTVQSATFAPDGSTLAVLTPGRLLLLDVATGTVTPVDTRPIEPYSTLAWAPDGSQLFWASRGGDALHLGRVRPGIGVDEVDLPLGGTSFMLALSAGDASSFLPSTDALGPARDCLPPEVQPSDRAAGVVCGFRVTADADAAAPSTTTTAPAVEAPAVDPAQLYRWSGTVIDDGSGVRLCAGQLSAGPGAPACSAGIPMAGWSWDDVDGDVALDGVTSGSYTVTGTWDGAVFQVESTAPYEVPMDGGIHGPPPTAAGGASQQGLTDVARFLDSPDAARVLGPVLTRSTDFADGYVVVVVAVATPEMQQAMDERFGAGVVEVTGALEPVGG